MAGSGLSAQCRGTPIEAHPVHPAGGIVERRHGGPPFTRSSERFIGGIGAEIDAVQGDRQRTHEPCSMLPIELVERLAALEAEFSSHRRALALLLAVRGAHTSYTP